MFGCRTNGALRWDDVRALHGLGKKEYAPAETMLRATPPGNRGRLLLWQPEDESFPRSGGFPPVRIGYESPEPEADYAGIVESTLATLYLYSRSFMTTAETLSVTGGAAASPGVLRRVAAIWDRSAVPIGHTGAALGAAVSGAYMLLAGQGKSPPQSEFAASFVERRPALTPDPEDVAVFHRPGGVLDQICAAYERVTGARV
jgi:sugar (pentulose or hexulose) kinase